MTKKSDRGRYANPEGSATWEYISATSCTFLLLAVGGVLGWNSPALPELLGPESHIIFTESDASLITTALSCGLTIAPVVSFFMADNLGRRRSLLIAGVPMMIGWGLIAIAKHVWVLFLARLLCGMSVNLTFVLVPMYMGEIASVRLRGTLGTLIGTIINAGLLVTFIILPHVKVVPTAYVCLFVVIISEIMLWFIPESPYYLVMIGKDEEAEAALEKLRGKPDVTEELTMIKQTISENSRVKTSSPENGGGIKDGEKFGTLKQLLRVRGNRKAFGINILFTFVLHMGGYTLLMIYGTLIIGAMNTGVSSNLCLAIIATLQLVCNLVTAFTINKIGRRTLVLVSGGVGGISYLSVGIYFYLMEHTNFDVTPYRLFPLFMTALFIITMNLGITPLVMVVMSETFAPEIKALATCLVTVIGGAFSAIGAHLFLALAITWRLGYATSFIGCFFCLTIGSALILKLLPETRGKTLLEIQRNLNE